MYGSIVPGLCTSTQGAHAQRSTQALLCARGSGGDQGALATTTHKML
jgi:hypothetical protein